MAGHCLEARYAFLQRGMGAEEIGDARAEAEHGPDDEHLFGAGVALLQGDALAVCPQPLQGVGEVEGIAAEMGAGVVGEIFPGTGYGHLDEAGGEGREEGENQGRDGVAAAVLVAAAEYRRELEDVGQGDDGGGEDAGDGLDEDVPVDDVADFVGDDAPQLFRGHELEYPFGDGHDGVFGIPAGGEGVGRLLGHDVEPWCGDAGVPGEFRHGVVQVGGLGPVELPGPVHGEDDPVGIPVAAEIHQEG